MNYLIWPIAIFIADYLNVTFPTYFGKRIQLYAYVLFICIALIKSKGEIPKDSFNKKVIQFIGIFLVMQLASMFLSNVRIGAAAYNKNPITTFVAFLGFVVGIIVHYYVVRLNINSFKDIKKFLKGGWIALLITLVVCLVQLCYLFMPSIFKPVVEFIGNTIEASWDGIYATKLDETSFYRLGSYVQTTLRLNGLTEEAPSLATQVFVIFVPFILASIKNQFNVFGSKENKMYPLYISTILILVILVMAKTTSGFLFAGIILIMLMKNMTGLQRTAVIAVTVLGGFLLYQFNFKNQYLMDSINNFLLNKNQDSVSNRAGNTLALLETTLKNFVLGIGWEYHSYYIFDNLPEWARHNTEYFGYLKKGEFSVLTVLLSWTAEYGLLIVGIVIAYIVKTQKQFRKLSIQSSELNLNESKLIKVLCDASYYYLIFTLISSLFLYVWYTSVYLIVYFFFVSIIQLLKKKVSISASSRVEGLYEKN
ncbi:hypothetical protein KM918_03760 [Priestia megaterium]|uniref:hypothetical protein n=1 Tax=Priestia megaterium TaxID=1404 RepID=UPI001C251125|nr:hypothetical protein [Priestia megaterium]MBU8686468.1 hypothetical protein [Priestia megaterium]